MAQEAIKTSAGNHQEIEKDFRYFYQFLAGDAIVKAHQGETKTIRDLKKEYARKHKIRAEQELKEQRQLAIIMQKELNDYTLSYKRLRSRYKKYQSQTTDFALKKLADRIEESAQQLQRHMVQVVQHTARYKQAYDDLRV